MTKQLRSIIQTKVENKVARRIIAGAVKPGDEVRNLGTGAEPIQCQYEQIQFLEGEAFFQDLSSQSGG